MLAVLAVEDKDALGIAVRRGVPLGRVVALPPSVGAAEAVAGWALPDAPTAVPVAPALEALGPMEGEVEAEALLQALTVLPGVALAKGEGVTPVLALEEEAAEVLGSASAVALAVEQAVPWSCVAEAATEAAASAEAVPLRDALVADEGVTPVLALEEEAAEVLNSASAVVLTVEQAVPGSCVAEAGAEAEASAEAVLLRAVLALPCAEVEGAGESLDCRDAVLPAAKEELACMDALAAPPGLRVAFTGLREGEGDREGEEEALRDAAGDALCRGLREVLGQEDALAVAAALGEAEPGPRGVGVPSASPVPLGWGVPDATGSWVWQGEPQPEAVALTATVGVGRCGEREGMGDAVRTPVLLPEALDTEEGDDCKLALGRADLETLAEALVEAVGCREGVMAALLLRSCEALALALMLELPLAVPAASAPPPPPPPPLGEAVTVALRLAAPPLALPTLLLLTVRDAVEPWERDARRDEEGVGVELVDKEGTSETEVERVESVEEDWLEEEEAEGEGVMEALAHGLALPVDVEVSDCEGEEVPLAQIVAVGETLGLLLGLREGEIVLLSVRVALELREREDVSHCEPLRVRVGELEALRVAAPLGLGDCVCVAEVQEEAEGLLEVLRVKLEQEEALCEGEEEEEGQGEAELELETQAVALGEPGRVALRAPVSVLQGEAVGDRCSEASGLEERVRVRLDVPEGERVRDSVPLPVAQKVALGVPDTVEQVVGEAESDAVAHAVALLHCVGVLLCEGEPVREGEAEAHGEGVAVGECVPLVLGQPLAVKEAVTEPERVGVKLTHALGLRVGEGVVVWQCELVAVPHTLSDCDVVRLCEPVAVGHALRRIDGEEEVLGDAVEQVVGEAESDAVAHAVALLHCVGVLLCEGEPVREGEAEAHGEGVAVGECVPLVLGQRLPVKETVTEPERVGV